MRRILLTLAMLACAGSAPAALVEVPPDDYLMINPSIFGAVDPLLADMVQSETAPHPVADRVALIWTFDMGTGPRDVVVGVLDANTASGEALAQVDDTEAYVRDPAIAYDDGTGQWLAVWAQEHAPGAYEIYGRLVYPDGTMNAAPFRISTTGTNDLDPAFDAVQPTVSSNQAGTFLVAWVADDDAIGSADGQFQITYRMVNAQTEALGSVNRFFYSGAGQASIDPDAGYFYGIDSWFLVWEQDLNNDPAIHQPSIFGDYVPGSGAPRQARGPFNLSEPGAARRALSSDRNPAIAIDRLNQRMGITWNTVPGGAVAERYVFAGIWDDNVTLLTSTNLADLDLAGYGASAYVRDPDVTHSRISDSFVFGWRESLNPDGSGQTLKVAEFSETGGVLTPPFTFVNQSASPGFAEFGPPRLEGGWRANGRLLAIWESDAGTPGYMENWGQGFDLAAVVDAPPAKTPREFAVRIAPNPFNPRTEIALALPVAGRARVDIYDVRGRLVRRLVDEDFPAGTYARTWEGLDDVGRPVASGVYLVKVSHPSGQRVTKVALVE